MLSSCIGAVTLNLLRLRLWLGALPIDPHCKLQRDATQPPLHVPDEVSGSRVAEAMHQIAVAIFASCPDRSKYPAGKRGDTIYRNDVSEWENNAAKDIERLEKLEAQVAPISPCDA